MSQMNTEEHDAIVNDVLTELQDRRTLGNKILLSRREAILLASGTIGLGALGVHGVQPAEAQATGQVGTSAEPLSAVFTDDLTVNNRVATVHGTTNTSVPDTTTTKVDQDVIDQADTSIFTVDLSNDEINVDVAGDYVVIARTRWDNDASNWTTGDSIDLVIQINGSVEEVNEIKKVGTETQSVEITTYLEDVTANDTITVHVFQNSGATISLNQTVNRTEFSVYKVG